MKGKVDIISSLTPPSIHDMWLNLNDNNLYRYGGNGWLSLRDNIKPENMPDSMQADFMSPDSDGPSFIRNNPFFTWEKVIISSGDVGITKEIYFTYTESPIYLNNGDRHSVLLPGGRGIIYNTEGVKIASITHNFNKLTCLVTNPGVFWFAQPRSIANWEARSTELGYIENKPFNGGSKVTGIVGTRISINCSAPNLNPENIRLTLKYEGKYYRLPEVVNESISIDGAFAITFTGKYGSGNAPTYRYTTTNPASGRDNVFYIESNVGATELCDLHIPNTIARNWKILNGNISNSRFFYNPNILDNHTYYILKSTSEAPISNIVDQSGLGFRPSEVFEIKFFIEYAGSETKPFSFSIGKAILWEGGFPTLTGQSVEITIKYVGDITLGSVKIYE